MMTIFLNYLYISMPLPFPCRRFPRTIYLQIDGGSENANGVFLALVELLVIKGLARNIKVSRLKVGHTHEDIDGIFGVLWEGTVCVLLS